jgi:hypothetical protein
VIYEAAFHNKNMATEGGVAMWGNNVGAYLTVDDEDDYVDAAADASGCSTKKVG